MEMAERNIEIEGYDVAAFLSQQSVEKLLKCIFALEGKRIPKSHYIDELAHKLGLSEEVIDDVMDLVADYTFARYPDVSENVPYEEYDKEIANEKVEKAKQIFEFLRERYKSLVEGGR